MMDNLDFHLYKMCKIRKYKTFLSQFNLVNYQLSF